MKVLAISAALFFCVFAASLLTGRAIETIALNQPMLGDTVFRHPRPIKNGTHFLTDQQESILSIASPMVLVVFGVTAILFVTLMHWQGRIEKEKKQQALNRVASSLDSGPYSAI